MSDKIKELIERIKNLSKTDNYQIKILDENPEIYESKIGGIAYWTPDLVYPENKFNLPIPYKDYPHYKSIIGSDGNDTLIGDAKNITVSALGGGKFTVNDDITEHDLDYVLDLTNLETTSSYTIHYHETTNYNADEQTVIVSVLNNYTTTLTIEEVKAAVTPLVDAKLYSLITRE